MTDKPVYVFRGEALASYGFGDEHPFGQDRHNAFHDELSRQPQNERLRYVDPATCQAADLTLFHTPSYVDRVAALSERGVGYLDQGDTPAFPGVYAAASAVVGSTLAAVDAVMCGDAGRAFVPIGGLHHATRDSAAGFCVFNDCGIGAEHLRERHGLRRIAYVDIDAHHGDGVYYAFEDDPLVVFADIHEDGRYLYPGTGSSAEVGVGPARGTKLNIPLPPGSGDDAFMVAWQAVEAHIDAAKPEFILLQCGADSLAGDPITHLNFTEEAHAFAASRLCALADRHCDGRIVGLGGGGYNRRNLARAWTRVVQAFAA